MSITDAQRAAHEKYFKKAYSQIKLSMPNDEAEALEKFCNEHGYSKAGLIRRAIREEMDTSKNNSKLDSAIALVAAATGETTKQLITRHLMQSLHDDITCLAMGLFKMAGGYNRDRIEQLNDVVFKATGFNGDQWILENHIEKGEEPMTDEARAYVLGHQDKQSRTILPGEVD